VTTERLVPAAAIDPGPTRSPGGRFGFRPIQGEVVGVEADHLVVGGERGFEQFHTSRSAQ